MNLSDKICKNCEFFNRYESRKDSGRCTNAESAANGSEMNKISYCNKFKAKIENKTEER